MDLATLLQRNAIVNLAER